MTIRVAVGPFDPSDPGADWPVYQCETLAPDFQIVPFGPDQYEIERVDSLVAWSPEYAGHVACDYDCHRVAVVGDWHVVPFEQMPWLNDYDLICADKKGVKRLIELGYPSEKLLYFRQFSFDSRLHFPPDKSTVRDLDVAFMGRDVPTRRPFLDALREWGQRTGRRVHIETEYQRGREADIYRRTKIAWRMSQRDELPMGVYEAAACGAMAALQHGALAEIQAAGAPIPAYSTSNVRALERFLEAWLDDSTWLDRLRDRQRAWVQTERPVDHLGWLCRRIKERMGGEHHTGCRDHPADSGVMPNRVGTVGCVPEPSLSDQRPECVALVPETARKVLDIGCGAGGVGWALRQRDPAIEVTGVDADERVADVAKARLTRFVQAGVEVPEGAPLWAALREYGPYDAILCLDVLEHLFDPWAALKRLRPLLAPDGLLVASVPNIRNAANLHELAVRGQWRYFRHGQMDFRGPADNILSWEHLRFFTRDSLAAMLRECGYRVERWDATHFAPPAPDTPMARWVKDLRRLALIHGGDAAKLDESLLVMQWLVVCRPDWEAMV